MPQPIGRDLDLTRSQLAGWLAGRLPDTGELTIEDLRGPKDTGFSSDTLMFSLAYQEAGRSIRQPMVIRLEPASEFKVFPGYDVELQYAMMRALADTPVPVPRMYWLETDRAPLGAPFYVMEKLDGQVPSDSPPYQQTGWIFELRPELRERLWNSGLDAMAEVHKLDWQKPEFSFLARPAAGTKPIESQLKYWDDYLDWGMDRARYPLVCEGLDWLRANRPEQEPTGICWGDSRISNQIFQDCRAAAVIDWEMVFIGNPVADLAWFITIDRCFSEGIGLARLPGLPGREATIARWEQRVGRAAEHFAYYELFAAFRFSAIMARVFLQMKHYGILPEDVAADRDNMASLVLDKLLHEVGAR